MFTQVFGLIPLVLWGHQPSTRPVTAATTTIPHQWGQAQLAPPSQLPPQAPVPLPQTPLRSPTHQIESLKVFLPLAPSEAKIP